MVPSAAGRQAASSAKRRADGHDAVRASAMGTVGASMNREYEQHRQATAAAIHAARNMVSGESVSPNTPISRLGDSEWQWIVVAAIFAFIRTRSQQATREGRDIELTVHTTGASLEPWDEGAINTILPQLAETPGFDWSRKISDWPRDVIVKFLATAFELMRKAFAARDRAGGVTRPSTTSREARDASLTTAEQLNDEIPW